MSISNKQETWCLTHRCKHVPSHVRITTFKCGCASMVDTRFGQYSPVPIFWCPYCGTKLANTDDWNDEDE